MGMDIIRLEYSVLEELESVELDSLKNNEYVYRKKITMTWRIIQWLNTHLKVDKEYCSIYIGTI